MSIWEIIGGILMIVTSALIVILVVMQESTKGGISALSGSDSYYNKNQGRTMDAMLSKATKYAAIIFFVLTILVYAINVKLG